METYRMIEGKDVISFINTFFKFVKSILVYVLLSVKKYFILAVLIFLIIAGLGVYRSTQQQAYYQAKMALAFTQLNRKTFGQMVNILNELAANKDYNALANALNIPLDVADKIVSIDGRNVMGSPLHEDANGDHTPMYFTLTAKSNNAFKPVQTALFNYLNTSPYTVNRNDNEIKANERQLTLIHEDLHRIDSVILSYSTFLHHTSASHDSVAGFHNVAALFSYKDQLEEKARNIEISTKLLENSVELLYGFATPNKPTKVGNTSWLKFVLLGLVAGIVAALGLMLMKDSGIISENPTGKTA